MHWSLSAISSLCFNLLLRAVPLTLVCGCGKAGSSAWIALVRRGCFLPSWGVFYVLMCPGRSEDTHQCKYSNRDLWSQQECTPWAGSWGMQFPVVVKMNRHLMGFFHESALSFNVFKWQKVRICALSSSLNVTYLQNRVYT